MLNAFIPGVTGGGAGTKGAGTSALPGTPVVLAMEQQQQEHENDNEDDDEEDDNVTTVSVLEQEVSNSSSSSGCLEGNLLMRKGRSSASGGVSSSLLLWKKRYVYLDFAQGGIFSVYEEKVQDKRKSTPASPLSRRITKQGSVYSRFHRGSAPAYNPQTTSATETATTTSSTTTPKELVLYLAPHVPWTVKDVENASSTFVVEVPTDQAELQHLTDAGDHMSVVTGLEQDDNNNNNNNNNSDDDDSRIVVEQALQDDLKAARKKRKTVVRIYFKCRKGDSEKALWFQAFQKLPGRLSLEHRRQLRGMLAKFSHGVVQNIQGTARSRPRTPSKFQFARDAKRIDDADDDQQQNYTTTTTTTTTTTRTTTTTDNPNDIHNNNNNNNTSLLGPQQDGINTNSATVSRINQMYFGPPSDSTTTTLSSASSQETAKQQQQQANDSKEYKVVPGYAYPHRWMTHKELHEEMMLPSAHFHDLRRLLQQQQIPPIGSLHVEVLQCLGLPHMDQSLSGANDTDAVVYLVCGTAAFCTDVIPDMTNPMWLRNTQRACTMPLYHGYARLFVGVFDDNGGQKKDDFIGRVVIDIAKLRPHSTYDIALPLRISTHVYQRRRKYGAIRLRMTVHWDATTSPANVLWSYIPKKIKFVPPQKAKPNVSTTICCGNAKAFRNVAFTVHGAHMNGHFCFAKIKSLAREVNFTRKHVIGGIRQELIDTRTWVHPTISMYVFGAWMHCIYQDKFSFVPGYFVFYLVLQLMRTYATYVLHAAMQEGFLPPTWEELLSLLTGSGTVEPLDIHRPRPGEGVTSNNNNNNMVIQTHSPRGLWLFRLLGFLPWDTTTTNTTKDPSLHLEFPFADGETYPRITIRESLADYKDEDETDLVEEEEIEEEEMDEIMDVTEEDDTDDRITTSTSSFKHKKSKNNLSHHKQTSTSSKQQQQKTSSMPVVKESEGETPVVDFDDSQQDDDDDDDSSGIRRPTTGPAIVRAGVEEMARKMQEGAHEMGMPQVAILSPRDQDLDWSVPGKKKEPVHDTLAMVGFRMHSATFQAFHDPVYHVKNPNSLYFGESNKTTGMRLVRNWKNKKVVEKKLDKLLGVRQYSNSNPLISRLGLFVEPIVDAVFGYVCGFRALFNILAWQDQNLTFLLSVALILVGIVLFIIPWRPTLFAVGMLFVGPQNYIIRKLRERGTFGTPKPKEKKTATSEDNNNNHDVVVFHGHKRMEGILGPKPSPAVDPLATQHIVVPYGPLKYQRFYDWPPELAYTTVVPTTLKNTQQHQQQQHKGPPPLLDNSDTAMTTTSRITSTTTTTNNNNNNNTTNNSNKKPNLVSRVLSRRRRQQRQRLPPRKPSSLEDLNEGEQDDDNDDEMNTSKVE